MAGMPIGRHMTTKGKGSMLADRSSISCNHTGIHKQQQDDCNPLSRIHRADNSPGRAVSRLVYTTVRAPLSALLLAIPTFLSNEMATSRPA